jgi:transcriptional pleiotropic regulator of transition state genes
MESSNTVRQIDELGRIVLPLEVRAALDWGNKTPVKIMMRQETGQVILCRHTASCDYCGSTEGLTKCCKKHTCINCKIKVGLLLTRSGM